MAKLKKNLNPINVWAIAFGCIIGWGAFVNPGKRFLPNSGVAGTAIAFVIGALVMIIFSFSYAFMVKECPEAGGEFSYSKKYLTKVVAFICGWFLIAAYLSNVPMNSTAIGLIFEGLFGNILKFGPHYSIAGFEIWLGEIIVSVSILLVFSILNIYGVKKTAFIQTLLAGLLVVSVIALFVASFFSKDVNIANLDPIWGFKYMEGKVIPKDNIAVSILATFAIAPWAFVGFDTIPQAAEEVKFSHKKVIFVMVIAIAFGAFVYISNNTVAALVLKNWPEECAAGKWVLLIAAEKMLGVFGKVLIGTAVFSAVLSGIMGFYYASSRLMYSMSKDNYLPKTFSKINKHGCPSNALIFCLIVSLTGPFLGREALSWFVDMSSVGATVGFFIASLCCFLLTKNRKDKKGLMILAALGMFFAINFIFIQLIPLPGLEGVSFTWQSYILFGVWVLLGLLFMFIKRKDIGLTKGSFMSFINALFRRKDNVVILSNNLNINKLDALIKSFNKNKKINEIYLVSNSDNKELIKLENKYNKVILVSNNNDISINEFDIVNYLLKSNRNTYFTNNLSNVAYLKVKDAIILADEIIKEDTIDNEFINSFINSNSITFDRYINA